MNNMENLEGINQQQPIELRPFGKTYEVYTDSRKYKFSNLKELQDLLLPPNPKVKFTDIILIAQNAMNDLSNKLNSHPEYQELIHIIDKYMDASLFEVIEDTEFEEPKENIVLSENEKIEKKESLDNKKKKNNVSIKKTARLFNFSMEKEKPLSKGEEEISRALIDGKWSINEELSFGDDIHEVSPEEQITKELHRSIIRFNGKQYTDAQSLLNDLRKTFPEEGNIINTIILFLQINAMADVTTELLVGDRNSKLHRDLKIQNDMFSITNLMNDAQSLELRNIKNKNLQFLIQVPLIVRYEDRDKYMGLIRVINISREDANKKWEKNSFIPSLTVKDLFVAEQDTLNAVQTKLLQLRNKRL